VAAPTEAEWAGIITEWDDHHPSEMEDDYPDPEEDAEYSEEAMDLIPDIPTEDRIPHEIDYSVRGPEDFVRSGPLPMEPVNDDEPAPIAGRGEMYPSREDALLAMQQRYGAHRVYPWDPGVEARWAFLIKKERT
jgi:hypothetical protein